MLRVFKEIHEEKLVVNVITNLKYFGEWPKWEAAMQLDLRWHSLLAYQTDNQLQFRLLAAEDQFSTPSRLHAWGQGDGMCRLGCGNSKRGSVLHILCNGKVTMQEEKQWG